MLHRCLAGTGVGEREWVVLRLAAQLDGTADAGALAAAAADRARFEDAPDLVATLTGRGLLDGGGLTGDGRRVVTEVGASIAALTGPVWAGLDAGDVAAATRVLNEVVERARRALG